MTGARTAVVLAVARYLTADVVRSQRVLLPLIVHAAVLAVLFGGDPGPPPAPWAASALVLYAVAAWLAVVVAGAEDPAQRAVTVAAAGGRRPVAAGTLLVALAADLLLVGLSVLWPVLVTRYPHPAPVLVAGVLGHLATAGAGTAVGLLCARPVVERIGWTFCAAAVVVVATGVQPWLPPVGTAVAALSEGGRVPVAEAVLGAVLAVAASAVTVLVERRR